MGSILSNLSTQNVAVVVVVVSAVSYMAVQRIFISGPSSSGDVVRTSPEAGAAASGKKGKRKKAGANAQSDIGGGAPTSSSGVKPIVVPFPAVIPGAFDSTAASGQEQQGDATSKSSKSKKKKGKKAATTPVIGGGARNVPVDAQSESSATAPESHAPTPKSAPKKKSPVPKLPSVSLVDTDDTWTRVEPRRRPSAQSAAPHSRETSGTLGSDAGVSTPVTGNSSPIAEREDDDSHEPAEENRRTLAEKLLPKPRKTGVDDMLETPDFPTISRVMRVQPRSDEQPAAGFSWGDYEDVDDSRTADDADGEDEGGWVVKSSRTRPKVNGPATSEQQAQAQRAPESVTKKQRQNAAKHEAQKAARAAADAERRAVLAKHQQELKNARMMEQEASSKKSKTSGGMSASMNEKGQLVWD